MTRSILPLLLLIMLAPPAAAGTLRHAEPGQALRMADVTRADERVFIVQLAAPPVLQYRGGDSLPRTQPRNGEPLDTQSDAVRRYSRHLTDAHDRLLASVGAWQSKIYSYRYTFNGFAARMTAAQAQKLASHKSVLRVWEDQVRYLQTNSSPSFLGLLSQGNGLRTGLELDGENVVIGVIDSGIAPEHPSFSDTREADRPTICRSTWSETALLGLWLCKRWRNQPDITTFDPPEGWNGHCEAGEQFTADQCNNKLIGARFYVDGFLENQFLDDNEFLSPRDADGHGTHIASTAAGIDVRASIGGTGLGRVSGMAPRARIAVYKACWLEPGQMRASCAVSDLQRAIEDAVADGVDIINYSVGNTDISITDPDDLALLAASDAGVLPVVAAGNDGPHVLGNILSPSGAPWVLTVAASSRTGTQFDEAIRVNAPSSVADDYVAREAAFTPLLSERGPFTEDLILVDDSNGVSSDACESIGNGAELNGKIAFVQRGGCDFEVKLVNAEDAGAIAAVVFNTQGEPIIMAGTRGAVDIPAVMIGQSDGQLLLAELDEGIGVEVTLDKSIVIEQSDVGDIMGTFSSSGPNLTAPDILKPDVTAPGVDILAGQSPDVANGVRGELFQYLSGTSMSVPHVAGIAALLREAKPDWSPAMIRSALMTTARQDVLKQDAATQADPFDFGSGHIVPNSAVDPGLVYDAGKNDYDAFTCGTPTPRVTSEECAALQAAGFPFEPANLNLPSIAVSDLVSERTIRRRVTNVGEPGQYRVEIDAPDGITMEVAPEVLSLNTGETDTYEVALQGDGADPDVWQFGSITWSDETHTVHSPVAVRPVRFTAPLEIAGDNTIGETGFEVQFGYTGDYSATVHGLVPADVFSTSVQNDAEKNYEFIPETSELPPSVRRLQFDVPENQVYLRVKLFRADTDGDDDLDIYVYRCPGLILCETVGIGGSFDADEEVDILFPNPGEYFIDIHGFRTDEVTGGPGANFDISVWVIGVDDDRGNLVVVPPASAAAGASETVTVSWSGLEVLRYLGGITHANAPGLITEFNDPRFLEFTLLEINHD